MNRKGTETITEIVATLVCLAIVVIAISIIFILNVIHTYPSDVAGYGVSFVKTMDEPFSFVEGMSHMKYNNRQVFEGLIEMSATGRPSSAGMSGLDDALMKYTSSYKKPFFLASFSESGKNIFEITNVGGVSIQSLVCGEDAYCTDDKTGGTTYSMGGICPVGTVKINDDLKKCKSSQYCCKFDSKAYMDQSRKSQADFRKVSNNIFSIIRCGKGRVGICNPTLSLINAQVPGAINKPIELPNCGNGYTETEDISKACSTANNGMTPTCCAPVVDVSLEKAQITQRSETAFLYKGRILFEPKSYKCVDSRTEKCVDGEDVTSLCNDPNDHIKCCVTDKISCKPPNSKYYCMTESHCTGTTIDNFCPGPGGYKCCIMDNPEPYVQDNEADGRTAEPGDHGTCYLGDNAYTDLPIIGKLEVSTG